MSNKFEAAIQIGKGIYQLGKTVAKKLKGNKQTFTGKAINTTKPGTKLTYKRGKQDEFVKFRDNLHTSAKFDTATRNKLKSKAPLTKINKSTSDIITPDEPKFNKGGRVEYKRGTGLKRKSNVEKIKETFSPKNKIKFDAKKSDLDKSGDLSKYEKARGMAIAKAMAKRKNKKVI